MNSTVSIFIPVYRESDLLEPLLRDLLTDLYQPKEIFVIIDDPTERSLDIVKRMKEEVSFILNGHRMGKVNALNKAVERSSGGILLFLDSDVKLVEDGQSFLEKVADEIQEADILDIKKKVIRDSFTARIAHYDYLCSNIVIWLFSKYLRRSLGFNGAAFAIRKETFERLGGFRRVVADDMDLGTRSYLSNCSFKHTEKIEVATKAPSGLREWYRQRKRWGIGTALWIREYYKDLLRIVVHSPRFLLPAIFLICPSLILLVINLLVPEPLYCKLLMVPLLFAATQVGILLPPILFAFIGMTVVKNVTASAASFGVLSILYGLLARKLKYTFNLLEFLCFYFVFSPLFLIIVIVSLLKVCMQPDKISIDWKC